MIHAKISPMVAYCVGVCRSCGRDSGSELGVAQRSQPAHCSGNKKGQDHGWSCVVLGLDPGERENSGADDHAYAETDEVFQPEAFDELASFTGDSGLIVLLMEDVFHRFQPEHAEMLSVFWG